MRKMLIMLTLLSSAPAYAENTCKLWYDASRQQFVDYATSGNPTLRTGFYTTFKLMEKYCGEPAGKADDMLSALDEERQRQITVIEPSRKDREPVICFNYGWMAMCD